MPHCVNWSLLLPFGTRPVVDCVYQLLLETSELNREVTKPMRSNYECSAVCGGHVRTYGVASMQKHELALRVNSVYTVHFVAEFIINK